MLVSVNLRREDLFARYGGEEFAIVRKRHIYYDDNGVMQRGKHRRYRENFRMEDEYPDNIWDATLEWRRKNPPVLGVEFWDIAGLYRRPTPVGGQRW